TAPRLGLLVAHNPCRVAAVFDDYVRLLRLPAVAPNLPHGSWFRTNPGIFDHRREVGHRAHRCVIGYLPRRKNRSQTATCRLGSPRLDVAGWCGGAASRSTRRAHDGIDLWAGFVDG